MSNLRLSYLSYLQKVGGIFIQAIPPTQKSGGMYPPIPPGIYASDIPKVNPKACGITLWDTSQNL